MQNPQKTVELFHLIFLRYMGEKLDKSLYSIKGGCNLRFFFKNIRYSEDLDIDIKTIAKETLRNKIQRLLESQIFQQMLSTRGIELERISEAKQTETTQRWKLSIKIQNMPMPLPTKIEFSRRKFDEISLFEPIDPELIQSHQLYPILINHYALEAAISQKIDALIHRTETQARDIFDLQLLLEKKCKAKFSFSLDAATNNIISVSFPEFKSQVVAYLMDEYQDYYDSVEIWSNMQKKVIERLKECHETS